MATILIVEDDPVIGSSLHQIIADAFDADVILETSIGGAEQHLSGPLHFVLLDVNVRDLTSFLLARTLALSGVPFAFASGSSRSTIPDDLRSAPFLAKPCCAQAILDAVCSAMPLQARAGTRQPKGG